MLAGAQNSAIYEYGLLNPYNVSTAIFLASYDVSAQETEPTGVFFSDDGYQMFVTGTSSDMVHQYSLTGPFTLTGGTIDLSARLPSTTPPGTTHVNTQNPGFRDIAFSDNGDNVVLLDTAGVVNVYNGATPTYTLERRLDARTMPDQQLALLNPNLYDVRIFESLNAPIPRGNITTTGVDIQLLDTEESIPSLNGIIPQSIAIPDDQGRRLYVVESSDNNYLLEYNMTTANTFSFSDSLGVILQRVTSLSDFGISNMTGITFHEDDTHMFIVGVDTSTGRHTVFQFTLPPPTAERTGTDNLTPNVHSLVLSHKFDIHDRVITPTDIAFSSERIQFEVPPPESLDSITAYGFRMYISDSGANSTDPGRIHEYVLGNYHHPSLGTAFDLSDSVRYIQAIPTVNQTSPQGMAFYDENDRNESDRRYMYVIGDSNNNIDEYIYRGGITERNHNNDRFGILEFGMLNPTTGTQSFRVISVNSNSLTFSPNGSLLFITDRDPNTVSQYRLGTPFNAVSAGAPIHTFTNASNFNSGSNAQDVSFSLNGTIMYILTS